MLRRVGACLAAGAALALCLPKPGLCFLAWGAPAVLMAGLRRARSPREATLLAGAAGAAFCGTALHWVYLTCRFAGVAAPVALLAWAALAAVLASSWAAFGLIARLAGRLPEAAWPWALAAAWAGVEAAGSRWTPRLGVDTLAYTQWRHLAWIQGGAVFGPHGLGFLIVLWNAALAQWWDGRLRGAGRANMLAAAGLLAAWWGWGAWTLAGGPLIQDGVAVEILQPDIDQYRKWDARYDAEIRAALDGLLAQERPGGAPPELVVWPEASLPGWLDEPGNLDWVQAWARRLSAPMLAGALTRGPGTAHNSAVLVDPEGALAGVYHKRRLVPFGEFVPLRPFLAPWVGILDRMGDFDPGPRRQPLLQLGAWTAAASLCYEAAFPALALEDAGRGARLFVNVTNDGWYKDTWAPYQHYYANRFRAVETRAFVLRAANTGISGLFDPFGRELARGPILARLRLDARLPALDPFPRGSFAARRGDWFGTLCLLATVAGCAWGGAARLRPRR